MQTHQEYDLATIRFSLDRELLHRGIATGEIEPFNLNGATLHGVQLALIEAIDANAITVPPRRDIKLYPKELDNPWEFIVAVWDTTGIAGTRMIAGTVDPWVLLDGPAAAEQVTETVLEEIARTANTVLEQVDVLASIAARQRDDDAATGVAFLA